MKMCKKVLDVFKLLLYMLFTPQRKWDFSKFDYEVLETVLNVDIAGRHFFIWLKNKIMNHNLGKLLSKNKIKVAFVAYNSGTWSCDRLLRLYMEDERYDPYVVLIGYADGTRGSIENMYEYSKAFFLEKEYPLIPAYERGTRKSQKTWRDLGAFDIIFWGTGYEEVLPQSLYIRNCPLNIISINVPYGFNLTKQGREYRIILNQLNVKLCWMVIGLFEQDRLDYADACDIGNGHVVNSGYPKMDVFFESGETNRDIWKIKDGAYSDVAKIVYAPHHTIGKGNKCVGTLLYNEEAIYQYAKAHPDTTSWIVRPHQQLCRSMLKQGKVSSVREYYQYFERWNRLENARVIFEGSYMDAFKTSDALIHDCISFQAEYLYTKQPQLFLVRNVDSLDKSSRRILNAIYTCDGKNISGIYEFIDRVVLKKDDYKKNQRLRLFERTFDYTAYNHMLASDYIKAYIERAILLCQCKKKPDEEGNK